MTVLHVELIIVLRTQHLGSGEAAANLNALHAMRVFSFEVSMVIHSCSMQQTDATDVPDHSRLRRYTGSSWACIGGCQPTFEAGRDMKAFASSASSLSNTGEPRPLGHALITHVTSPPQESPLFRTSSITAHSSALPHNL